MKTFLSILLIFIPLLLFAQEFDFSHEYNVIPVSFDGVECQVPWTTGYNYINPTFCDIDGDGDFDLLIGGDWNQVVFFRNEGTNLIHDFSFTSDSLINLPTQPLPQFTSKTAFVDIDNDDDLDLFIGTWFDEPPWTGKLLFYENIGNIFSYNFVLREFPYQGIEFDGDLYPTFVDLDNDSDYDLSIGMGDIGSLDGKIYYYINQGTPDSAIFVLDTTDLVSTGLTEEAIPTFIDIDDDGVFDLFVGTHDGNIHYYRNEGTPEEYDFVLVTEHYAGVDVANIASPTFCDIDGDGDYDLFVGERSWGEDDNHGDVWFYENIGSPESAAFQLITQNFVTMDVGKSPPTAFADIDNDGLTDMFIGDTDGNINYFANIGTETEPGFALADQNFQNITATYQSRPTFGDLDWDGDLDLLIGRASYNTGSIHYYRNDGTIEVPDYNLIAQNYLGIDYEKPAPRLIDIDNDNDLDLFVGTGYNRLIYWENQGSILNPQFVLIDTNYLDTPINYENFLFCFGDIDNDGDYDLIRGNLSGYLEFYRNIGTPELPILVLEEDHFLSIELLNDTEPNLEDIDNDGDLDLFVGDYSGGVSFWRNNEENSVNREPSTVNRSFALYPNYPNPFNESTTIPFTLDQKLPVKVVVYNQLGQVVWDLGFRIWDLGENKVVWDAEGFASGVYLVRLTADGGWSMAKPVILLK